MSTPERGPVRVVDDYLGRYPGYWWYRDLGFRAPRKGEFYLSGAIVEAYRAPSDLATPYRVVELVRQAKQMMVWI